MRVGRQWNENLIGEKLMNHLLNLVSFYKSWQIWGTIRNRKWNLVKDQKVDNWKKIKLGNSNESL